MVSKEELISDLRKVYEFYGKPFSRKEYRAVGAYASDTFERRFGSWAAALKAAKLGEKFTKFKKIHEEKTNFAPEKELEKKWKQEKSELLSKYETKELKKFKEKSHKLDLLREMVYEAVSSLTPMSVQYTPQKETKKSSKVRENLSLWFEFSDLQLGTHMTLEEMGGLNEHNWSIWKHKLKIWKDSVIHKISAYDQDGYTIDSIVLACLGDMVEGQDIFSGQVWQVDRPVVGQALAGAEDTAAAFAEIILTFPHLKFHILEVFGNHGRVGKKGETPYSNSMDKVYQRFLQLRLASIPKMTNYTYHENEAWFYFVQLYGWNHLLLHGDRGMSSLWSSRPTINGLEKGVVRYNQMLQQQVHFVHCGHFHNDCQLSMNMSQLLINGSFIGTSNFSASQMVASSPPVQVMHVFSPRVGLERTERIHLVDGDVRHPITPHKILS